MTIGRVPLLTSSQSTREKIQSASHAREQSRENEWGRESKGERESAREREGREREKGELSTRGRGGLNRGGDYHVNHRLFSKSPKSRRFLFTES